MLNIKSSIVLLGITSSLFANVAFAGTCDVNVEATPAMAFNVKEIAVPKTCKEITLNLKNTGTMAKAVMGHNIVISKTTDMQSVLADGSTAGLANNYVKQNDERVIGHTSVIGGGETTSVKIKLSNVKASDGYSFYCSFPGHASVMKGVFKLI
ncbi:azurin [Methylotenera sp.]|uniref:azurin n=1 Tax=Methylotenera sp. TaxID=2051956 RepID=UPI00248A42B9|nr:azurin [Methylotenera sp.]MDI1299289.1 azurin [Methylotenera sp.]